ncbi:hypothetical protein [Enterococcus sp. AZ194]|uniref:hypothetical protein n=1 Tax=Enterococcus sp. AZ194 TaxID=2774629 RepID=UPI003F684086
MSNVKERQKIYIAKNFTVYSIYLKDKFSNYGLVGTVIQKEKICYLMCLSCRALGKGAEEKILEWMERRIDSLLFFETGSNHILKQRISAQTPTIQLIDQSTEDFYG